MVVPVDNNYLREHKEMPCMKRLLLYLRLKMLFKAVTGKEKKKRKERKYKKQYFIGKVFPVFLISKNIKNEILCLLGPEAGLNQVFLPLYGRGGGGAVPCCLTV